MDRELTKVHWRYDLTQKRLDGFFNWQKFTLAVGPVLQNIPESRTRAGGATRTIRSERENSGSSAAPGTSTPRPAFAGRRRWAGPSPTASPTSPPTRAVTTGTGTPTSSRHDCDVLFGKGGDGMVDLEEVGGPLKFSEHHGAATFYKGLLWHCGGQNSLRQV